MKKKNGSVVSVLFADDNEINRVLMNAQLRHRGANITAAKNGMEALELIQHQPFDLILLDLNMPDLSGIEVMRHLQNNPPLVNKDTPFIAITAYAPKDTLPLLSQVGFSDCLIKPILEEQLNGIVNQYVLLKNKGSRTE